MISAERDLDFGLAQIIPKQLPATMDSFGAENYYRIRDALETSTTYNDFLRSLVNEEDYYRLRDEPLILDLMGRYSRTPASL